MFLTAAGPAALQAKKQQQQELKQVLDYQMNLKKEKQATLRTHADSYAQSIQEQHDAWEAQQAAELQRKKQVAAAYQTQLAQQINDDTARKSQLKAMQRQGPLGTRTISEAAGTAHLPTGELKPYALREEAVLSTLGVAVRLDVVSVDDGRPLFNTKRTRQ